MNSLTYSPILPPPVCETWIQYWNKDLHTKKYIVDKKQDDCVLFHLPVQLTSYTQNRIISLQYNLPEYSLLREISCFMHIIKNKCSTCKLVFQYHPSVLHLCKLLQRYVWFSTVKQIQPKNVRNDDWKKKYPVQIEHLICICTCEVTRSKLADRSITVGWFHFVEVGNSRFSSMSTKTWNSSRTKMIYCPPSFSLEQDYTVLAHRSCSEKQHNTKEKINSAYSKETDFSVLSTAWGLQCFKVKELNKHWLGVTIRLNL